MITLFGYLEWSKSFVRQLLYTSSATFYVDHNLKKKNVIFLSSQLFFPETGKTAGNQVKTVILHFLRNFFKPKRFARSFDQRKCLSFFLNSIQPFRTPFFRPRSEGGYPVVQKYLRSFFFFSLFRSRLDVSFDEYFPPLPRVCTYEMISTRNGADGRKRTNANVPDAHPFPRRAKTNNNYYTVSEPVQTRCESSIFPGTRVDEPSYITIGQGGTIRTRGSLAPSEASADERSATVILSRQISIRFYFILFFFIY